MGNAEFAEKLEKRTLEFSIRCLGLSRSITSGIETDIIRRQLSKSATSIGANYREANMSRSRADFKNKLKICQGEANESKYWLTLIESQQWAKGREVESLIKESQELVALFTSIVNKL